MELSTQANRFFDACTYSLVPGKALTLVTWQLKTPENVGSIIRTAGNLGASRVVVVLPDGISYKGYKYERVAGAALQTIDVIITNVDEAWLQIDERSVCVALETAPQSVNLYETHLPDNMTLIVGNEQRGLPVEIIDRCQMAVHIPLPGEIKSMNVSHATSVAACEWYRQMAFKAWEQK